jgi:hypothetical protein
VAGDPRNEAMPALTFSCPGGESSRNGRSAPGAPTGQLSP